MLVVGGMVMMVRNVLGAYHEYQSHNGLVSRSLVEVNTKACLILPSVVTNRFIEFSSLFDRAADPGLAGL